MENMSENKLFLINKFYNFKDEDLEIGIPLKRNYKESDKKQIIKKKVEYIDIKKAEKELDDFSIGVTGARIDDIIIGLSKGTKGGIIKIHGKDIPPRELLLDRLRFHEDIWNRFLIKLGSIEFFSSMTINEKRNMVI